MKKFLALAALIAVGSAYAEELKFGDLNYFLLAGRSNATLDFNSNNEAVRMGKTTKTEVDSYMFNAAYTYAINDRLNAFIGVEGLFRGETKEAAAKRSDDAQGFQNPRFGANYRLLNQNSNDAGVNLDFGAIANVKVVDRKIGTPTKEGNIIDPQVSNYYDPRSGLELNARLGKKWNEANEFYLLAGSVFNLDGKYKQLQGNTYKVDSSIDLKAGAFYQYRPVNEFMMAFGVTGLRKGDMDGKVAGVDYTVKNRIDYQFSFLAKYLITETFIAKVLLTHDRRDNYNVTSNGADTKFDKRNANQMGVGVDFLF